MREEVQVLSGLSDLSDLSGVDLIFDLFKRLDAIIDLLNQIKRDADYRTNWLPRGGRLVNIGTTTTNIVENNSPDVRVVNIINIGVGGTIRLSPRTPIAANDGRPLFVEKNEVIFLKPGDILYGISPLAQDAWLEDVTL